MAGFQRRTQSKDLLFPGSAHIFTDWKEKNRSFAAAQDDNFLLEIKKADLSQGAAF